MAGAWDPGGCTPHPTRDGKKPNAVAWTAGKEKPRACYMLPIPEPSAPSAALLKSPAGLRDASGLHASCWSKPRHHEDCNFYSFVDLRDHYDHSYYYSDYSYSLLFLIFPCYSFLFLFVQSVLVLVVPLTLFEL